MLRFYTSMRIKNNDNSTFTSGGFYNLTARVQENTILNRGLIDIGAVAGQVVTSNNKDEKIERGILCGLYFMFSFMAPFVLLPFFNKTFLKRNGIVKDFTNSERKIIEVSKKYLTKDVNYLIEGVRKTAKKIEAEAAKKGKKINVKDDFENILNRFKDKNELKNNLLKTHENILFADFLATAWMWCATPWVSTQVTKLRTNRSGYSGTYEMVNEAQSKNNTQNEQGKKKKLLISAAIATIPPLILPKLITKGFNNKSGSLSTIVKKYSEHFNYSKGVFMSKAIFAGMWLFCDYPSALVSARDKYERRDRAIRNLSAILVFFGGDFVLNNAIGQLSDKYLHTQIMDRSKLKPNASFISKLTMSPKNFAELEDSVKLPSQLLKRTKNIGASMYWLTLLANTLIIGFGVPIFLNKLLKKSVNEDLAKQDKSTQII